MNISVTFTSRMDIYRLDQPAIVNSVKEGEITETGDLYSQVEPVWVSIIIIINATQDSVPSANNRKTVIVLLVSKVSLRTKDKDLVLSH